MIYLDFVVLYLCLCSIFPFLFLEKEDLLFSWVANKCGVNNITHILTYLKSLSVRREFCSQEQRWNCFATEMERCIFHWVNIFFHPHMNICFILIKYNFRGVIFPDFRIFWVASGFFELWFVFLKPKKSHRKKKKKSRANVIIISSDCEEETNIERSWNFRPTLTSVSVCEVHIPDWFCCAQVGDREYRHICFWQHVKDGSIRSYRQGWLFVNWQGAQKPLEILMARGGTKYWRLTSCTQ